MKLMYARVKFFTISVHTFEIPDFVQFQSPGNRFLFSEPVRPLFNDNFKFPIFKIQWPPEGQKWTLVHLLSCVFTMYSAHEGTIGDFFHRLA